MFFSVICLLIISCKKEAEIFKKNKNSEIKDTLRESSQILSFKYFDTILNSDIGKGVLKYNKHTKFKQSDIVNRYIIMYTSISKENIQWKNTDDFEKIDNSAQGAFLDTVGDGTFYFDYKFNEAGKQNLKMFFVDLIDYKDTISNKVRSVYYFSNASVPVMVIDSNSVLGIKNRKLYYETSRTIYVKRKDSLRLAKKQQRKKDSIQRILNN